MRWICALSSGRYDEQPSFQSSLHMLIVLMCVSLLEVMFLFFVVFSCRENRNFNRNETDKLICNMPLKSSGGFSRLDWQHAMQCAYMYRHACTQQLQGSRIYSSNYYHHIYQTLWAGSIITYSAVFKCMSLKLWLQIQGRIVIVPECELFTVSLSPFSHKWVFFFLLSYLKLDSLLINHNYFANDVHGNALWCLWDRASNSRSRKLIQTCHR